MEEEEGEITIIYANSELTVPKYYDAPGGARRVITDVVSNRELLEEVTASLFAKAERLEADADKQRKIAGALKGLAEQTDRNQQSPPAKSAWLDDNQPF